MTTTRLDPRWSLKLDGPAESFPCGQQACSSQGTEICCYVALFKCGRGYTLRVHYKGYAAKFNEWQSASQASMVDPDGVAAFIEANKHNLWNRHLPYSRAPKSVPIEAWRAASFVDKSGQFWMPLSLPYLNRLHDKEGVPLDIDFESVRRQRGTHSLARTREQLGVEENEAKLRFGLRTNWVQTTWVPMTLLKHACEQLPPVPEHHDDDDDKKWPTQADCDVAMQELQQVGPESVAAFQRAQTEMRAAYRVARESVHKHAIVTKAREEAQRLKAVADEAAVRAQQLQQEATAAQRSADALASPDVLAQRVRIAREREEKRKRRRGES